jgi:hypothetical protein
MLAHQSEPFLKLTSQFVAEVSEANRLRRQLLELSDALRDVALLPKDESDAAPEMARAALNAYYAKVFGDAR